jgi:hypothetical protein
MNKRLGGVDAVSAPIAKPTGGPGPVSAAHGDFVYNGGAVITCPLIYASFWGKHWGLPARQAQQARLVQFLKDMVASSWMNVMSQYGAGTGAGSGLFMQSSFIANVQVNINNTDLTDANIQTILQNAINAGTIPEPPANNKSQVVIIFLDESVGVKDPSLRITMCEPSGDNAFGYHFDFETAKGNECYYAVIPSLDDQCIKNTCPGACSLNLAETQEQRRTQVVSHEFAEMITDPKFQSGWFGPASDENGDICNGQTATITVGANTWNVQRTYSKIDDINSNGANFCIASAPAPIPKLAGGPAAIATTAELSPARFNAYQAFLPLPTAHFDAVSQHGTLDEAHVQTYVRNLFFPLDHSNVIGHIPATLRQVADILEKVAKK